MSSLSASLLAQTIDDHIVWMAAWNRLAFYSLADQEMREESVPMPESFALWRSEAAKTLQDQPALARLTDVYDQLHRAARLVLLKTPEGTPLALGDYNSIALKYQELIIGLRRIERAVATAESGLDTLTGLRSRVGMRDELTRELNRFQRSGKPFCLALMDIDHFKKINDTYGHESGDRVLSAVANHLSRCLRSFDDAWRWGGEEFLLCLKEADIVTGGLALERVRTGLEKLSIKLGNGIEVTVTASFGIVPADTNKTIDVLMEQTDKALYRAKHEGRNRIVAG